MSPEEPLTARLYFSQVAKIIEGAVNADHAKVLAYTEQLSQYLEKSGELESAKRLRQSLGKGRVHKLALAKMPNSRQGTMPQIPVDGESRLPMADELLFKPEDVRVFLADNAQKSVNQFITFFRAADQLTANGVGIAASMLLYGPPGCGKTQVARHISAQLGLPLITARMDGVISSYLGSTAKNLRLLFEHAMSRPCVLFLDEFDALAKMRDDTRELGELKRVVISILQNIDALGKDHALIAATNHEHLLDPAIWRRFNYKVNISHPTFENRINILQKAFLRYSETELVELVASLTEGVSGALLQTLAEDCVRKAIISDVAQLNWLETIREFASLNSSLSYNASQTDDDLMKALRKTDLKRFTQARLSAIFGLSQSQVSKALKNAL